MNSSIFRKVLDLLLYGNFFIAFCAVAMLWQTEWILYKTIQWNELTTFVFSATLFLYALHRIVGIEKVKAFNEKYRYHIIEQYKNHILAYALIGGGLSAYYFFYLSFSNQLLLLIPAFLSLGYVAPFFGKNRRLRDFDYIKIFLVAIVWAFITVVLPIVERQGVAISLENGVLLLERMFFIFAITLPFDIRDIKVDQHIQVKTIPAMIGIAQSKRLGAGLLIGAMLLATILFKMELYTLRNLLALGISYATTYLLIAYSDQTDHDYFFTGLMDGTMLFQFFSFIFFHLFPSRSNNTKLSVTKL